MSDKNITLNENIADKINEPADEIEAEAHDVNWSELEDKMVKLGEGELQLFRFLLDRPAGVYLTYETDILLAKLLAMDNLVEYSEEDNKTIIPAELRDAYRENWADELTLKWRKYNWMYKCIEAGKNLYGVMSYEDLKNLFAIRYPNAGMEEMKELFNTTPMAYQWFTEREEGKLVLNGFERDNYYKQLEQIQEGVPTYIPTKEEIEELYDNECLISRDGHRALKEYIMETFGVDEAVAVRKMSELYDSVNNHIRMNDAADEFATEEGFAFKSDEDQFKFIEKYIEMSRECRIRDNRGHDYYEMVGIMAGQNRNGQSKNKQQPVRRVKIGRNEPCPCGSGKKYKNCCGKNA